MRTGLVEHVDRNAVADKAADKVVAQAVAAGKPEEQLEPVVAHHSFDKTAHFVALVCHTLNKTSKIPFFLDRALG